MPAPGDTRQQGFAPSAGKLGLKEGLERLGLGPRQRKRVQHDGASDRNHGGELAQDGPVSGQKQQRFSGAQLSEGCPSRLEFVHAMERYLSNRFRGEGVEVDASAVLERPRILQK